MTSEPNGRVLRTALGHDLVLSRTFRAPLEDVWASVTDSDRTARWFGPWEGEPGAGQTIKVRMSYEEQQPTMEMRIDACEPPRRLALSSTDESGDWRMELLLAHADGITELQLVHHLDSTGAVGEIGPGWEYYLDMLTASRDNTPQPSFDDYYPAMKPHYEALVGTLS
ncbi:SRPBCC family protein [Actinoplanes couchii]|uniref:Activator of Hsp90 ATPase homologue 1/2-like C-terminal domain-containing protein n=1 Tax=Actinoplanes couchii TaxID=403638 RepID=A0ABQ3X918_9ACTN|nr:SRPBCC family protein [Actinoplanes couchii]MDR6325881.1 uncharacterized protein YndB with AHSA1/START domain [Actinoplanes couchii]GID54949.1 hypothetical protein Aco03nite_033530 [Actinoplanes couchii]